jgi:hypothetical protein
MDFLIGDRILDNDGDFAKVEEIKDNFLRVLLLSGPCKGKKLWVMTQDVTKENK